MASRASRGGACVCGGVRGVGLEQCQVESPCQGVLRHPGPVFTAQPAQEVPVRRDDSDSGLSGVV